MKLILFLVSLVLFIMTQPPHSVCVAGAQNGPPPPKTNPLYAGPPGKRHIKWDDSLFKRPNIPVDQKLKRLCNHTDYFSLCFSTLSPAFAASGKPFSISSSLSVTIKATSQHANKAATAAAKLAAKSSTSSSDLKGLKVCKDQYADALDNLKEAAAALAKKDLGTVDSMLSAVVTGSSNCGDATKGTEAAETLAKYNDKLRKMASNCLAISTLIYY